MEQEDGVIEIITFEWRRPLTAAPTAAAVFEPSLVWSGRRPRIDLLSFLSSFCWCCCCCGVPPINCHHSLPHSIYSNGETIISESCAAKAARQCVLVLANRIQQSWQDSLICQEEE